MASEGLDWRVSVRALALIQRDGLEDGQRRDDSYLCVAEGGGSPLPKAIQRAPTVWLGGLILLFVAGLGLPGQGGGGGIHAPSNTAPTCIPAWASPVDRREPVFPGVPQALSDVIFRRCKRMIRKVQ